jgi:glucose dehydrogenase
MKPAPILSCFALCLPALAQTKIPASDWPMYTRDLTGSRYSPLDQINTRNVATLQRAWTYGLRTEAERAISGTGSAFSQVTPIVVNGVMYITTGKRVVALEPETGKELWAYEAKSDVATRGVAYWPGDTNNPPRLITSAGRTLFALNAKSGKLSPGFGKEGEADIVVPYNSPPTIYKNLMSRKCRDPIPHLATRAPTTPEQEPKYGSFAASRSRARKAARPGAETIGRTALASTTGAST